MKSLTPDVLAATVAQNTTVVKFPIRNISVNVRALDAAQLVRLTDYTQGKDENDPEFNKNAEVLICSLGITDHNYDTPQGREQLAKLNDGMRKRIANAILGLTGLDGANAKN